MFQLLLSLFTSKDLYLCWMDFTSEKMEDLGTQSDHNVANTRYFSLGTGRAMTWHPAQQQLPAVPPGAAAWPQCLLMSLSALIWRYLPRWVTACAIVQGEAPFQSWSLHGGWSLLMVSTGFQENSKNQQMQWIKECSWPFFHLGTWLLFTMVCYPSSTPGPLAKSVPWRCKK